VAEGGAGLSSRARVASARTNARSKSHSVKRGKPESGAASKWGATLRTVLFSPGDGFKRSLRLSRSKESDRVRSIVMPILAGLGGAFLMLLFLKARGVVGFEGVQPAEFKWRDYTLALVISGFAGVFAHYLFGLLARYVVGRGTQRTESRELRTIWSVAALPVALTFALFVVLDVFIGGRDVYLTPREGDSLVMGWAIGSFVLAAGAAIWSFLLFIKGLGIAGDMRPPRTIGVVLLSGLSVVIAAPIALAFVFGSISVVSFFVDLIQAVAK
jgi:hypothetical protein